MVSSGGRLPSNDTALRVRADRRRLQRLEGKTLNKPNAADALAHKAAIDYLKQRFAVGEKRPALTLSISQPLPSSPGKQISDCCPANRPAIKPTAYRDDKGASIDHCLIRRSRQASSLFPAPSPFAD